MTTADIYAWLNKKNPAGADWTSKSFSALQEFPLEIRMFLEMEKLEGEVENGGLAQFLWNTYFHWRTILKDCEKAYELIGAQPQHAVVPQIISLCGQHEADCGRYVALATKTPEGNYFQRWYDLAEEALSTDAEDLFCSHDELEGQRVRWLEQNQSHLQQLMYGNKG
ncbi:MAG: DUF4375 domain-containing protein [Kiritimatiellaeota bacterium]|nr:DUF4375 domain-containing protein [Kiritimatiellota bacterium]